MLLKNQTPPPAKTSRGNKYHGFTLIEMLVVIAIISILASLLLPSINRSLEMVKQVNCGNNLRQNSLIINNYANDYNGVVFLKFSLGPGTTQNWYTLAKSYIGENTNILLCPYFEPYTFQKTGSSQTYGVYAPNFSNRGFIKYNGSANLATFALNLNILQTPSRVVTFTDSLKAADKTQIYTTFLSATDTGYGIHLRHLDRASALFADGHTAALSATEFYEHAINKFFTGDGSFFNY